jgi:hypothetical protein
MYILSRRVCPHLTRPRSPPRPAAAVGGCVHTEFSTPKNAAGRTEYASLQASRPSPWGVSSLFSGHQVLPLFVTVLPPGFQYY